MGDPIEGAEVSVSKDFDNNGTTDYYAKVVTGVDGSYTIVVPKGNTTYDLSIKKPVEIGNSTVVKTFEQVANVGSLADQENEASNKTATGLILTKAIDVTENLLNNYSGYNIDVYSADGSGNINLNDKVNGANASIVNSGENKGIFTINGLEKGKTYVMAVTYTIVNPVTKASQKIIVGTLPITVSSDGQINICTALIDPYGIVNDSSTGDPINGATAVLYYANTSNNLINGISPNTRVDLPIVSGFSPNNNANPQNTNVSGEYAFMVYPNTDYYLVVSKNGYHSYTTDTIHVGMMIVHNDPINLDPITNENSASTEKSTSTTKSTSTSTTESTGVVIDETGEVVQAVETKVTTEADGTKDLSVKSKDAILFKQSDGTKISLDNFSNIGFSSTENSNFALSSDGQTIQVKNLASGTEEKANVTFDLGNGQKIIIGTINVKSDTNGNISFTSQLIDPYGIVTDAAGNAVSGATATLYYANTPENIKNGMIPNTKVILPTIQGFAPNNNANSQNTNIKGEYAFMVYPNADYYIVVSKEGYYPYTTNTIHVGTELVQNEPIKLNSINSDIAMNKYSFDTKSNEADNEKNVQNEDAEKSEDILPQTGAMLDSKVINILGGALISIGYILTGRRKRK